MDQEGLEEIRSCVFRAVRKAVVYRDDYTDYLDSAVRLLNYILELENRINDMKYENDMNRLKETLKKHTCKADEIIENLGCSIDEIVKNRS